MAVQAGRTTGPSRPPLVPTRRRGETLEHAIFDAVLDELQAVGYAGLTMEGVAARARTGKAALYRRWPCREDLIVDALHYALPSLADPPDHGNVRDDLLKRDPLNVLLARQVRQRLEAEVLRDVEIGRAHV